MSITASTASIWLVSAAFAGSAPTPAYYHPDDIAAKSARFASASEAMGPKFEAGEREVAQVGKAADRLEIGTALLGASASEDLHAWSTTTRRQISGQYLRLQKHVGLLQDDFSTVFGAALERALPGASSGKSVKPCSASKVAAMMGRSDCEGESLNSALAAAIDKDPQLQKDLADILAVEWPVIQLAPSVQAVVPVTGAEHWVSVWAVAEKFQGSKLAERENTLQVTLEGLADGIDAKDAAALAAAQAAKKSWESALAADGEVLRASVTSSMARQKSAPTWGWCANPKSLGGCPGDDVTIAVIDQLAADKKFQKTLE